MACISSSSVNCLIEGDNWLGVFIDGPLRALYSVFVITGVSSQLSGNDPVRKTAQSAIDVVGATLCTLSMIRSFFTYGAKLLPNPGRLFWQTDNSGWRKVDPIPISDPASWYKDVDRHAWVKGAGNQQQCISTHRLYIDSPLTEDTAIAAPRPWMDVACDVCRLAYRLLSPVCWLEYIRAIDLKEHSKWVCGLSSALLGVICTINLAQAVRDITSGRSLERIQKLVWEVVHSILELICLPFEFGLASYQPALAIAGAVLNVITACSLIAKEAVFYYS